MQVLMYALIITGSVLILGVFYKKVLAPIVAKRFPPSEAGGHGGGHGAATSSQNPIH